VITCVITDASNRAQQAANLIRSEAVAKFSSFRQLRVSTIQDFLAVMRVTSLRDAGQYVFAVHQVVLFRMRCVSHQSHDAVCIRRSHTA
jgi:hypothetical protein